MIDLLSYGMDRIRYANVYNALFWYKKHKGLEWIKGQNFGDYLSLIVVGEIARKKKLRIRSDVEGSKRLFAAGSILHFAGNGDVVWGSGINGKISKERHVFNELDVRMVRGKLTAEFLRKRGINVPEVYGDPVLLLPFLFPGLTRNPRKGKIIFIPNLNEMNSRRNKLSSSINFVSPFVYWFKILNEILASELVLSSSLHGIIAAEAFNVPVRFMMPAEPETLFKYQDYYTGTKRDLDVKSVKYEKEVRKTSGIEMPPPVFDRSAIVGSFPRDFFQEKE